MSVLSTLRNTAIFDEMSIQQLELIAAICQEKVLDAGEMLFRENMPGDGLYIIANGAMEILVDPSLVVGKPVGEPYPITTLRHNQSFGEISLVDEGKRSASARAVQFDTRLLFIPRGKLMLLCDSNPELGYRLMRNLAADMAMKIRNTDLTVRDQVHFALNQSQKKESGGQR